MYYYKAFDKTIKSEIALDGFLPATSNSPDIYINKQYSSVDTDNFPKNLKIIKVPGGLEFFSPYGTCYQVSHGNKVELISCKNTHPDLERIPFYGYIPASLLLQNGFLVLHGSAVTINGTTVLLAGGKGIGKSSLAASLIARGHQLISDDIAAVSTSGDSFTILSGIPVIKLWPKSLHLLSDRYKNHSDLYPGFDKQLCTIKETNFCQDRRELDIIVYLRRNITGTTFELIPRITDKMFLVSSSQYFISYPEIYSKRRKTKSFQIIDKLIRQKDIYRLSSFNDVSSLDESCDLIEDLVN